MNEQTPSAEFRVIFLGASQINFGSPEGAWNHSARLEQKLGPRLRVTALVDPDAKRAQEVLDMKRKSIAAGAYKDTQIYPDLEDYVQSVTKDTYPHALWVGTPPAFRGRLESGRNLEAVVVDKLPHVSMFIEKPVSTASVAETWQVSQSICKKKDTIVSVGYMLRYLKVVQKMKQIIQENNLTVTAVNGRYIMAYEYLTKQWWWNKKESLGPIIEQATHFADLARYFGGEVDLATVFAHTVEHHDDAGKLSKIPVAEHEVPPEERIPRVTSATWKYKNGAVGSLMHAVALHDQKFFTEMDVFADGYYMRLVDPYNAPALYVRRPGDEKEEVYKFPGDDPFFSEVNNLVDSIDHGPNAASILSLYDDATKTYAFTWAIRLASEKRTAELQSLAQLPM
ncbi:hypothetical protein MVES1_002471 [Malassezia vespertilionis]|uniref:Gfo/Idh/MocA-like oxidoreductase N-terminal domain-containing protein n=1 Tax=Malassezia vespertilionis TaxID=2020962 RepID=A0A2N1JAR7_9BASI|nr:uncharacterized protein MVES1_002471 [Malassezia vespertilionis]PKI83637.1 hypothetical protein MVES_002335 [Malassezia vespertilionis]WFD07114.1 hypothetical protein MVES1_002471 [Malassezia vespertilionis]